jgi:hypothetical protein
LQSQERKEEIWPRLTLIFYKVCSNSEWKYYFSGGRGAGASAVKWLNNIARKKLIPLGMKYA